MPGHSTLLSKPGMVSSDSKRKGIHQNEQRLLKRVRFVYTDPDLTDSSSDDEEGKQKYKCYTSHGVKRCVKEVCVFESVSNIKKNSKVTSQNVQNGMSLKSKYAGVRKRPSGKWSAEIRDTYHRVKLWLGTFDTEEEAHSAYEGRRLEIQSLMQQKQLNSKDARGVRFVAQSPSSVLEVPNTSSNANDRSYTNTNTDMSQDNSKKDVEEQKSGVDDEMKAGDIKDEIQGSKMVFEELNEEDFLMCNLGNLADCPNSSYLLDLDKEDWTWLDEILKFCGLED